MKSFINYSYCAIPSEIFVLHSVAEKLFTTNLDYSMSIINICLLHTSG